MKSETPAKGNSLHYDVPVLKGRPEGTLEVEVLLLAWTLLLYRQNNGNDVQYSWGTYDVGGPACRPFNLDTSSLIRARNGSISEALGNIQAYLQEQLQPQSTATLRQSTLFFNDECAPSDTLCEITKNGNESINWGNIQLQATVTDQGLRLECLWREPLGAEFLATYLAKSFVEILNITLVDSTTSIDSVLQLTELDHSIIWGWNKTVPPTTTTCIHELIAEQVRDRPSAEAICSWDGNFTYAEVDEYSTILARHLISLGVQIGDIVPLCFEKSRWTTIAVMAVIKAGAAFVLMDPSLPIQRRQIMATQVSARLILTSENQAVYGAEIVPGGGPTVIVDQERLLALDVPITDLPEVPPDSLLYIIFTSGSTGTPKGVMISHTTYSTSALARSTAIGYSSISRSLDFTSYAFDVSIDSILCTLLRGGCLCIPDDMDRVNDLSGAIRRLKVNMVNVTPSVARILDADIIPSLNSLGIGGESCSAGDISAWGQHTRVVVGYGPAECTIGCTVNANAAGRPYVSIGSGTGAVIWLVDPIDHNKLVPFGAVGELLVEGPIVGQGYLGDPEKTAASFIHDPQFLVDGGGGIPGRRGRLYKTGDLLRYDPDGDGGFIFVGRKDTQIKLRGQRVELGEIEYHIKNLLPSGSEVVAEITAPRNQNKESMLVAFIADREVAANDQGEPREAELPRLREAVASLSERLSKVLPVYMVPVRYICLNKIPMLVSGKTDRKSLRAIGAEVSASLHAASSDHQQAQIIHEPKSEAERFLREAWCGLLGLESKQISITHNFFMLGGDSILAMKLVPIVRNGGFTLSVADIFNYPILSAMAEAMKHDVVGSQESTMIPPFALLDPRLNRNALISEASEQCTCTAASIGDIYPCAPMQEVHMAFYTRSKENYIAQRVADIPDPSLIGRFKSAWERVFRESAILRTRIVEFKEHGFMQVVINQELQWEHVNASLDAFLEDDKKVPMSPGAPLSRFAIVHDEVVGQHYFVWTVHHAIYDGWSTDLIVEHAKAAYNDLHTQRPAEFKHFIRYLAEPSREVASKDYWRTQLEGATGPQFPRLPSRSFIPDPTSLAERFISLTQSARSEITIATVIRAAWALVASRYSMSDDVMFGETFMGRTVPIPGAELIEGPILATVPVRVRIDRTASIQEFLRSIQDQGIIRAAHDHLGIQHIRRLSPDAQIACEVTMGLVVQPRDPDALESENDGFPMFRAQDAALEALHFNSYPLMLACSLQKDGVRILASYDSNILSKRQVERLLSQFDCAVSQLRSDQSSPLSNITCLSEDNLEEIWELNQMQPLPPSDISKFLASGDRYPTFRYNPWIVDSTNKDLLMPIGAVGELLLEGIPNGDTAYTVDTPTWLEQGTAKIPGRQGRLYRTGDLVKYTEDMELVFVGRKDTITNVGGHNINLTATDLELKRLLPPSSNVLSRLVHPTGSLNQTPMMVAFVQESPSQQCQMVKLGTTFEDESIPDSISLELATSIIGLNKALAEVLPPYAIPSAYIPVKTMTDFGSSLITDVVDGLSQRITLTLLTDIRRCFGKLRQTITESTRLTEKERVLRSLWAEFLTVDEEELSLDDNFFRLGGDSIVAMRMVSALRREGYRLSVADIFQNMQLRDMANALVKTSTKSEPAENEYSPFSLLHLDNLDGFLSDHVRPSLQDPHWKIYDVLPVTDPQQRDVRATVSAPRSSVQYNMLYFDKSINTSHLIQCFQDLVSRHAILRTVFIEYNGRIFQVILDSMNVAVTESKIEGPLNVSCKSLAQADVELDITLAFGTPFVRLFVLHGERETALQIRISHAQYDGFSLPELIRQLEVRYKGIELPPSTPFTSYLQHLHNSEAENINFWREVLEGSSPTEITSRAPINSKTTFITKAINITGSSPDTTLAMLLTAGWATVMAQYLNVADVTFASIVSGRDFDIEGIDGIMGPCYQYMPVRVRFEPKWTATHLLDYIRKQYLEGSQRATLGFDEILSECTNWPTNTQFYGSFTNHLNREYFDKIPFADTECRVDYIIPHPEPPTPPRIVSFVEHGKTSIGIEADEDRKEFWLARLDELALTIEGFVNNPQNLLWAPDFVHLE